MLVPSIVKCPEAVTLSIHRPDGSAAGKKEYTLLDIWVGYMTIFTSTSHAVLCTLQFTNIILVHDNL